MVACAFGSNSIQSPSYRDTVEAVKGAMNALRTMHVHKPHTANMAAGPSNTKYQYLM